ncbi:excitatory amino acid transporter 1-like [Prorops nasuta]|uniref:excitatory amino acid transporter 1-like n=1 Tax=Prorops nasuta TaxID=863751 RepID=UPI0034CDC3CE
MNSRHTMEKLKQFLKDHMFTIATIGSIIVAVGFGFSLRNFKTDWTERDIMYIKYPGELYINSVSCLILPLITCSITAASCTLSQSGRIGILTLIYYLTTTTMGIALSIVLVETFRPGELDDSRDIISKTVTKSYMTIDTILDLLRNLTPDNLVEACFSQYQTILEPSEGQNAEQISEWKIKSQDVPGTNILGLVSFSIILGLALGKLGEDGKPAFNIIQSFNSTVMNIMLQLIIAAPVAILFLVPGRIVEIEHFGYLINRLGFYILIVFIGLLIQDFILLPMLYFMVTGGNPYKIIFKMGPAFIASFSTSSSTAAVPVTLKCLDDIGIKSEVSRLVVPIGSIINMDGIALYEAIGAIFITQLGNHQFPLEKVIILSITCTVSCIGATGLPGGGYVILILVLNSFGIAIEDVSLIIAIDCFVDRFRTMICIIADALGAAMVSYVTKEDTKTRRNLSKTMEMPEESHLIS